MRKGCQNIFGQVHTTLHILKRCPTKALKDKTPVEAWSGIKPSVSYFKKFGCICYAHVPAEKITKLDEKSQKCVFLGYSDVTKGYKLLDVKTNKLVVSRDVIFDEKTIWNWEDKKIENTAIISSNQEEDEKDEDVSQGGEISDSDNEEPPLRGTKMLSDIYQRCNFAGVEPENYEKAIKHDVWKKVMEEEIRMIEKNNTWELVAIPREREVVSLKWIYKIKLNHEGDIQKHKARLVARGFTQRPGIDFYETFSPVALLETIRIVIVVAAQKKWKIFQLDVK